MVPAEIAKIKGIKVNDAKKEVINLGKKLEATMPWYKLSYWEELFKVDLIKPAIKNSSYINFLPGAENTLKKLRKLNIEIILLTNCDSRLLSVKSNAVPFLKYANEVQSSTDLGLIKEDKDYWGVVFSKFSIDPSKSIFLDDNKSIVKMARNCGVESAYQVLEPTSDRSVIYMKSGLDCIENITWLI